jgi:hypothetical protein
MIRPMTSNVSVLSDIVANGHQVIHTFPLPPLKFRTVGFPQYGFKRAVSRALRLVAETLTRPQWRSPLSAFPFRNPSFCPPPPVSGLCRRLCSEQKVPNLLCLSLIPCRRLYSGGSKTWTDESARLAWPSPILSGLGNHNAHTTGSRVAC